MILSATLQAERLLRRRFAPGDPLSLSEIFPEADLAQTELALKETLASGVTRAQISTQILLPADPVRFLKYSVAPLYNRDQQIAGAVLAFHDAPLAKSRSARDHFGLGVEPGATIEHLDRGLFIVNPRQTITAFNRTAQELTGLAPEEVDAATAGRSSRRTTAKPGAP